MGHDACHADYIYIYANINVADVLIICRYLLKLTARQAFIDKPTLIIIDCSCTGTAGT